MKALSLVLVGGSLMFSSFVSAQVVDAGRLASAKRSGHSLIRELEGAITDIQDVINITQSPEVRRKLRTAIMKIENVEIKIMDSQGNGHSEGDGGHGHGGYGDNLSYGLAQVGDLVYLGTKYGLGATVVAVNVRNDRATVKSIKSGSIYSEVLSDLDVAKGCLELVCVGDVVYLGTKYGSGATVVALNYKTQLATVKSNRSGNLFVEDIMQLEVTTQSSLYDRSQRESSRRRK